MKKYISAITLLLLSASALCAGTIEYDGAEKAIKVNSFTEEKPATMQDLLAADQKEKWNIITFDEENKSYHINASLYIGSDNNLGTFVQIGSKENPAETVIIKGDVWIKPSKKSLQRRDGSYAITNRLTLGNEKDSSIKAVLKVECETRREFGIFIGLREQGKQPFRGGELFIFNSTITAATPDRDHMLRGNTRYKGMNTGWYANMVKIINSDISWVDGTLMYGVQQNNSVIKGSTFTNCGHVLQNGKQLAINCKFINSDYAVSEGGCLDARIINCTFENNNYNFSLGGLMGYRVVLIDCEIGPQNKPINIKKNSMKPAEALRRKLPIYPAYSELISIPVKVVNQQGKPVKEAIISVSCAEDPEAVENGLMITDKEGMTAENTEDNVTLITRKKYKATDKAGEYSEFTYNYIVKINAVGFKGKVINFSNSDEIARPLTVTLKKK
ncbi:MAG: right-handed parallel beta-helix repeat-containing protein [Planctomycetota bacterium]|jgi:hypothetical protein